MKNSWEGLHRWFKQAEELVNLNICQLTLCSLGNRKKQFKKMNKTLEVYGTNSRIWTWTIGIPEMMAKGACYSHGERDGLCSSKEDMLKS